MTDRGRMGTLKEKSRGPEPPRPETVRAAAMRARMAIDAALHDRNLDPLDGILFCAFVAGGLVAREPELAGLLRGRRRPTRAELLRDPDALDRYAGLLIDHEPSERPS